MRDPRSEVTLEELLYPIVILNRQGDISFMNGAARRLLPEGLDLRLATHIRKNPERPITQIHFKLQNGHDLVLKVRLGEIEWLGEKATQVSLSNVTPYLAMVQELRNELETQKRAPQKPAVCRPGPDQQLAAHSETPAKLQSELSAAAAEREELRPEIANRLASESSVRAAMKAEVAKLESLEMEIATVQQNLAARERAQSEGIARLKGAAGSHADALVQAREEAAARFAKGQQAKAAEAEKQAASGTWDLELAHGELNYRMAAALLWEEAWAQERAGLERGAHESLEKVAEHESSLEMSKFADMNLRLVFDDLTSQRPHGKSQTQEA